MKMPQAKVTIFKNIYDKEPHYITVQAALNRIREGKSRFRIEEIRTCLDKEKADSLKRQLPSVCFSGEFGSDRKDESIIAHSGFLVLDFDNVHDVSEKAAELVSNEFVYSMWLSPRGNGLKVLVKIADGLKHREHFAALQEIFPDVDRSGVNVSRVCYESYDPNIHINTKASIFNKIKKIEKIEVRETLSEERPIFSNLLKWLSNRSDAFVSGERNTFVFKLASACCRFGLAEDATVNLILSEYPSSNDFTHNECEKAIKSAYRANKQKQGSARFEKDILVDKVTRKEIEIDAAIYDETIKPRDVIYGADVKGNALKIYEKGYPFVRKLDIPLDDYFKSKRGELTVLTGIGNYGKSSWFKWFQLMRVLKFGEKFASFSPEDNPPEEYYFDFVEMLLGCDCTPYNINRPSVEVFSNAYDFVSKNIFYIYPSLESSPTVEYVKQRFLELIIKEKVDGVCIDPFNQMSHDYSRTGGRSDKYLEAVLGDLSRFAQTNNVYFTIIAHPKSMEKKADGNYPCPDVFDLNDGAMWNNKVDNILVYHRPVMQVNPDDPLAELHTKKIRRQKIIGKKGTLSMEYKRPSRRFEIIGADYLLNLLKEKGLTFKKEQTQITFKTYQNDYLEKLQDDNPF
jgi:hypothetical protein